MVQHELNYTGARPETAELMSAFPDMVMCGHCYKQEEVVLESGPTVLACYVGPLVAACDGYGTQKTMSGPRCTRSNKGDGCTSMLAKKRGTTQGYIQKVSTLYNPTHPISSDGDC